MNEWVLDGAADSVFLAGWTVDPRDIRWGVRCQVDETLTPEEAANQLGVESSLSALHWVWCSAEDDMLAPLEGELDASVVSLVSGIRLPLIAIPRFVGRPLTRDGLVALGYQPLETAIAPDPPDSDRRITLQALLKDLWIVERSMRRVRTFLNRAATAPLEAVIEAQEVMVAPKIDGPRFDAPRIDDVTRAAAKRLLRKSGFMVLK